MAKTKQVASSHPRATRSYDQRAEKKLAKIKEGARDPKTGERYSLKVLEGDSSYQRRRAPAVQEGLKIIRAKEEKEIVEDNLKKRVRYAAMRAHKEMAASVLAVGGTRKQAARSAGVSVRQIQKYYTDPEFRERIVELQEMLANKIRGRVMKEVGRRTKPELIQKMELLDLLRVGDRFGLGRGKASVVNVNQTQEIHNYESIFNSVFLNDENQEQLADSEEEGEDFPTFEPTGLALSGGDSPVEG